MPHGYPDGGHNTEQSTVKLVDMAELAKRLGSISTFDRSGNIIFQDDGSQGMNCLAVTAIAGYKLFRYASQAFISGSAIRMKIPTTGNPMVDVSKSAPIAVNGKVGLEFTYKLASQVMTSGAYLYIGLQVIKDGHFIDVRFKIMLYDDRIQFGVWNGSTYVYTYVTPSTAGGSKRYNVTSPLNFKILIDPEVGYCSYMLANGVYIDLAGYATRATSTTGTNSAAFDFQAYNTDTTWYIDIGDIILTDNEVERLK